MTAWIFVTRINYSFFEYPSLSNSSRLKSRLFFNHFYGTGFHARALTGHQSLLNLKGIAMKSKILVAVSGLAMMVAMTAYAETTFAGTVSSNGSTTTSTNTDTSLTMDKAKADLKEGWQNTKEAVSKATNATEEKYEDIKAKVISSNGNNSEVTINSRVTATGMIGKPVYNMKNEKVATVKDIIINDMGHAQKIIVSDGGFMGIGDKLAAFDYSAVAHQESNGDVIMPLSEETLSKVAAFSYDPKEASDKVQVLPANSYSVSTLLKGKIVDPKNTNIAKVDNITFKGGEASQVIAAFDQKLGMGGDKAVIDFRDLTLVKKSADDVNLRMNASESAQFERYKKTMTN